MKESLLIMHTRSKIQTSQNLIFKYLGISTTYTPQIVLFLGARCAPTIRHLALVSRCAALTQPHHTPHADQPPPPPTSTIRYRTRRLQCCYYCLLFAMLHATCHMHATCRLFFSHRPSTLNAYNNGDQATHHRGTRRWWQRVEPRLPPARWPLHPPPSSPNVACHRCCCRR